MVTHDQDGHFVLHARDFDPLSYRSPARAPPQTEIFDDPWATGAHATDVP